MCQEMLGQRSLIIASNRGPVEHQVGSDGRVHARRGSGGVVTALSALTAVVPFTWVACAMSEGDRKAAQEAEGGHIASSLPGQRILLRYVVTPRRMYHKYYNIFCNPLLWFLQHYMWSSPYTPNVDSTVYDAWKTGYIPVNEAFAKAIIEEARSLPAPPYIMLHDYHLYLTPGMLRQELPTAVIQHFIHIPWPTPIYWQLLPQSMRLPIVEGLCNSDIVGFQSTRDVRSFLHTAEDFLEGAQVDHVAQTVTHCGRTTMVRSYPISIDVAELRSIAASPRAREYEGKLEPLRNERTIVRVDRAEPSKNIVRGFRAYGVLLERHPELRGKVNFLAFLVPSRTHIRQYHRYLEEIDTQIQAVNQTFGTPDWQPIRVFYENNYTQAIAAMGLYDVLLVNPIIDGMNLVAKEGPVVNTKAGVLILSDAAGAYEQLRPGVIAVAPADIEGTMEALYQALTMPQEERERRAATLGDIIQRADITEWVCSQLEDLHTLVPRQQP